MPNFQHGIQQALARFATEMADQIGRSRGSASADHDLNEARGLLNYAPDIWYVSCGLDRRELGDPIREGDGQAQQLQHAPGGR